MILRTFKTAFRNLKSTTLRTALAILGIVVGTASVVTLISVGQMGTEAALAEFKTLGTNLLSINLNNRKAGEGGEGVGEGQKFSLDQAKKIKNASAAIEVIAPYIGTFSSILYQGRSIDATIIGVTQSLSELVHIQMLAGRFISSFDKYEQYCVLGYDIYAQLNTSAQNLIGRRISLGSYRYTIIGIASKWPESSFFDQNVNTSILVPILTAQFLIRQPTDINTIIIRLRPNVADIPGIKNQIEKYINQIAPGKEIFFRSAQELIKSMQAQQNIFILLLGLIGGISLFVGGVGVMNIMLVSVIERRQEIGIRLAIGAHRTDIQWMFLAESILLAVIGGLIGVLIGVAFSLTVAAIEGWDLKVYIFPSLIGFLSSVTIGVFFGFYPAYQASKLDPIQTLRSE